LLRIIGILIPVIILVIYLSISGAILDFIDYAILGISTFTNKISYFGLFQDENIEIRILSILVPMTIVTMAIILIISKFVKKENKEIQNILTIFIYSLSIIVVMYPISDKIHFLIGSFIAIIGLAYIICLLVKKIYNKINYEKKYKLYKIVSLLVWLGIFVWITTTGVNNIYKYVKIEKNIKIPHYKNIEVWEELTDKINSIDNYILTKEKEGKSVYILDAEAAIYMIPLDKYNKDYDMFLKGNIGKEGEEGQIQKIRQKKENEIYLIRNKNIKANWQTPLKVTQYIRDNLDKTGEIETYEIYK